MALDAKASVPQEHMVATALHNVTVKTGRYAQKQMGNATALADGQAYTVKTNALMGSMGLIVT